VHAQPQSQSQASLIQQFGSFASSLTNLSATGPSGMAGLNWRVDGEYARSDGFRGQRSESYNLLPAISFRIADHDLRARFEYHHADTLPDASGLPFATPRGVGLPLPVTFDKTYYSPIAFATQDIKRFFLSDAWTLDSAFSVNQRLSYTERQVDLARNAGGTVTAVGSGFALARRQLRQQQDDISDFIYHVEPSWTGAIGGMAHHVVAGAEIRDVASRTTRSTADLPNIADLFNPVTVDGPLSALAFKCDATHSCADADLSARFIGLYVVDQIDVTDALKLRASARQNWFDSEGVARSLVPANPGQSQPCSPPRTVLCPWLPGVAISRTDQPLSWDVGAVYFLHPSLSVFGGYSTGAYPVFNTEEPESTGQVPERSTQAEGGVRFDLAPTLTITSSAFRTTRSNVFTVLVDAAGLDVPSVFSYRVEGVELDLNARPFEGLTINANMTRQFPTITGFPTAPANIGHAIPSVPSILANGWVAYEFTPSADIGALRLSAGMRYRNKEFADAASTRLVPGAPILNVGIAIPRDRWTLMVGVDNATDRRQFQYAAGAGGGAAPGPGRTAFVRMNAKLW
jgi:iron complex outermembrane receptor protein